MNSSKPIIAVDIDDVIAANAQGFVEYSNQKYGTNLSVDDYHEHWGEVWKVDQAEREKRSKEYHEGGHIASYGIIDGAKEALQKLKKDFRIIALTSRRQSINKLTSEWVNKYYPDIFETIVYAGIWDQITPESINMTKGELAKSIGAKYLLDDQPKHVFAAAELGVNGLLFGEYSWNKNVSLPSNVIRVKNWQEVLGYFEKELKVTY